MRKKKESIDEKIDNLAVMVAKGFDDVYKSFDDVYKSFDDVYKEFDKVHNEITDFKEEMNQNFETYVKTIRLDYDNLTGRVKRLEAHHK